MANIRLTARAQEGLLYALYTNAMEQGCYNSTTEEVVDTYHLSHGDKVDALCLVGWWKEDLIGMAKYMFQAYLIDPENLRGMIQRMVQKVLLANEHEKCGRDCKIRSEYTRPVERVVQGGCVVKDFKITAGGDIDIAVASEIAGDGNDATNDVEPALNDDGQGGKAGENDEDEWSELNDFNADLDVDDDSEWLHTI